MLSKVRKGIDKKTILLAKYFAFLTPNQITFLSIFLALVGVSLFYFRNPFSLLFYFFSFLFDALDGAVARFRKMQTRKGGYLDTIVDRYVEFIILFGFLFYPFPSLLFDFKFYLFLTLFGSLLTTYAKAAAMEKLNKKVIICFLERSERVILIFIACIFSFVYPFFTTLIFAFLSIATNFSALQRIYYTLK